jgi:type I restriction enzyme M protein
VNGSTWALAVMNMFLHGFDNAVIRWGDTIRNPKLKEGDALMKFDTVVANPPFSLDKWGKVEDKENEKEKSSTSFDPEKDRYNRFWRGIPPKSKGDWAFISHMLETAYEGRGKVGVVAPHGVLFRGGSEGKIRQRTIEDNQLEAVIGLPSNLFFGTGIPAAIVIFNKGKGSNENVLFIDGSQGFDPGKNQNRLRDKDIERIVNTYRTFSDGKLKPGVIEEKFSYVAKREELIENEYNLNIPRYVDTFEEEAEVDISRVQKEIEVLEKELKVVQSEMAKYLKQLDVK